MANNPQTDSRIARKKQHKSKKKHGVVYKVLMTVLYVFLAGIIGGAGLFTYYAWGAPTITQEKLTSGGSSIIYDIDNNQIKSLGTENRNYVKSDDIPQTLKDAVVSTEDKRFYEHFGVDPIRIAGAAMANITGSSLGLQGGSTLTQQLVKLSVFSTKASDQTLKRKAQEAWLAMKIERQYSKAQILEFYINKVYMNYGTYGMGTAAKYYYNKSLNDLSLPQIALIAGLPQSPSGYDPYTHPEQAKARRDIVIASMLANNKITKQQAAEAKNTPISSGLVAQTTTTTSSKDSVIDAYLKEVISEVQNKMGLNPYTDGLKIYTNIDMKAQQKLYDIVNTDNYVTFPDNKLQTAVTMVDPDNGKVLAMIGGRKTGNVQLGYNRAVQATRSNGSTMKPLMDYGPAIEYLNQSTYTQLDDSKYIYPGTNIQLYDWDFKYMGKISMRTALAQSRNVPAVKTLAKVGITRANQFLSGLGIHFKSDIGLSTGIGGNVSTLQEASAYAAFSNGGTYYKPYYINKIETADGAVHTYDSQGSRAMKSSTAYMITDMLKDVISKGTGTNAQISGLYQAGKTGTTDYSAAELSNSNIPSGTAKDSWFAGYTKNYSIAVWTGYDKPLENSLTPTQQTIAAKIYRSLMSYMAESSTNGDWTKPSSVVAENIVTGSDPATIAAANTGSSSYTQELFVSGYEPTRTAIAEIEPDIDTNRESEESSSSEASESSSVPQEQYPDQSSSSSTPTAESSTSTPPTTPSGGNTGGTNGTGGGTGQ